MVLRAIEPSVQRRQLLGLGLGLAPWAQATAAPPAGSSSAPSSLPTPPLRPVAPTLLSGYGLARNWDFRASMRTTEALRSEFHTRYVWDNGRVDFLNDEWSRYRDNRNHVFTDSGLSLVARAARDLAPGGIESGMIRSKWSGRYGVFEASMKVPSGRGTWPAFWLAAEDGGWPPEIDAVEIVNNAADGTRRSYHYLHGAGLRGRRTKSSRLDRHAAYSPGTDYAQQFHVFAVEWTSDSVRHYVDDALVADREYAWIHDDGRDGGAAHVIACLAVGGKWPGPPPADSLPAALDIEYIRVWQR